MVAVCIRRCVWCGGRHATVVDAKAQLFLLRVAVLSVQLMSGIDAAAAAAVAADAARIHVRAGGHLIACQPDERPDGQAKRTGCRGLREDITYPSLAAAQLTKLWYDTRALCAVPCASVARTLEEGEGGNRAMGPAAVPLVGGGTWQSRLYGVLVAVPTCPCVWRAGWLTGWLGTGCSHFFLSRSRAAPQQQRRQKYLGVCSSRARSSEKENKRASCAWFLFLYVAYVVRPPTRRPRQPCRPTADRLTLARSWSTESEQISHLL
ncbi:hypothetical protein IWZ00DRAFT_385555 [Phyllosticta capitalensis]